MTVQSKIDEGTTVTVALPLAFTPPAPQPSSNIATLTPALRSGPSNQASSGEEKCLDKLRRTTTCRAAAAARSAVAVEAEAERGLAMRILLHSPKDMVAGALAFAAVSAIIANALFLQAGHHPAPMFGSVVAIPPAGLAPASPLPRPRPVELATKPVDASPPEPKPAEPKAVEIQAAEPIWSRRTRRRAGGSARQSGQGHRRHRSRLRIPRPPASIPIAAQASRRVAAVQRALTEYGYGQLKPTGTIGSDTQAAIQKFERERKLPVTGQMSDRLVRELAP